METKKKSRRRRRSRTRTMQQRWFLRKHKNNNYPLQLHQISDDDDDDDLHHFQPCTTSPPHLNPNSNSSNQLRIFVGTWNVAGKSPVGSLAVDLDEWLNLRDAADLYVLGFQEVVPLKARTVIGAEDPTEATNWNLLIGKILNHKYGCPWLTPSVHPITDHNCDSPPTRSYSLISSKKMVGVFISVWMRQELVNNHGVYGVKACSVGCGIMGYLGNKGSVSISMSIGRTSFCFVAAHLASGEKKGDELRRNQQVADIFRRTTFARAAEEDHPLTILGHDRIFWFGDLNYRLYMEDNYARHLIKQQDWRGLQKFDQLRRELGNGGVFQGWNEGNIEFAPTYKYSSYNTNRYSGGNPSRAGEKQRTPAWCDRILWYGNGVRQVYYIRSESKFSDHRPVSGLFDSPLNPLNMLEQHNDDPKNC